MVIWAIFVPWQYLAKVLHFVCEFRGSRKRRWFPAFAGVTAESTRECLYSVAVDLWELDRGQCYAISSQWNGCLGWVGTDWGAMVTGRMGHILTTVTGFGIMQMTK
jgi:hypothetical protein